MPHKVDRGMDEAGIIKDLYARRILYETDPHLLAETRLPILAFGAMNERGCLGVETVEPAGVFVDEGVILRHKLPADLGRIDGVVGHGGAVKMTTRVR